MGKSRALVTAAGGAALLGGGLFGGLAYAGVANVTNESVGEQTDLQGREAPNVQVNARGETYGSALDARTPDEEPDLILAYGDDGTVGYVRSADRRPPDDLTLEEVRAANGRPIGPTSVPLYAEDGVTVIGTFSLSPNNVTVDGG